MIHELTETSKAAALFAGWPETMITSCLQGVMGRVFVTDTEDPRSALAFAGCFAFCAGEPDRELIDGRPAGTAIMVPRDEAWAALIEVCCPNARRVTRYAIRKDTRFDEAALKRMAGAVPDGCVLRRIDAELYDRCLEDPVTRDFVSSFADRQQFLELGRGVVLMKDGKIVSGASSYSRYREGIEIEVDTVPKERRKGLAATVCAALILHCLEEGLYPSWDAQNMASVHLAEKLGYVFSHEYTAFEVDSAPVGAACGTEERL